MTNQLIYTKIDDLTKYIFDYYQGLMTVYEVAAYKSVMAEEKAQNTDSPVTQQMLRRSWVFNTTEVSQLLHDGPEQFMVNVRDRILEEQADQVFLNLCPRCNTLARTPSAKQCPHCFYSWHDAS